MMSRDGSHSAAGVEEIQVDRLVRDFELITRYPKPEEVVSCRETISSPSSPRPAGGVHELLKEHKQSNEAME